MVSALQIVIFVLCCLHMIKGQQSTETMGTNVGALVLNKAWRIMDYYTPNAQFATRLNRAGLYIAGNAIPYDIQADSENSRVFLTTPQFKPGIPASLSYVLLNSTSPKLRPYPNWESHASPVKSCRTTMVSVFGITIDYVGNTLYAVDTGVANITVNPRRICPTKILIFNTTSNKLVYSVAIPNSVLKLESLPTAVQVERLSNGSRFVYIADTNGFALIVANLISGKAPTFWRWTSQWFYPTPGLGILNITGTTFQMMKGIYSIALDRRGNESRLFTTAFSSVRLGVIPTTILGQSTGGDLDRRLQIPVAGERRNPSGAMAIDESGNRLFFGDLPGTSFLCWNTNRGPYSAQRFRTLASNSTSLQFFNSVKLGSESTIWVLTSRYHKYATGTLNRNDTNFRIFTLNISDLEC